MNKETTSKKEKKQKTKNKTKPYTLEEIARMVRKINSEESEKSSKLKGMGAVISALAGLLFCFYIGYNLYKESKKKEEIDGSVQTYKADIFKNEVYYGKFNTLVYLLSLVDFSRLSEEKAQRVGNVSLKTLKSDTNLNFLLYGEPGTGKTAFIKKFAYHVDCLIKFLLLQENGVIKENTDFYDLGILKIINQMESCVKIIFADPSTYMSKWHGQGEQNLKHMFGEAKELKPRQYLIIFFDEIDAIGRHRGECTTGVNVDTLKNQLLMFMDGSISIKNRSRIIICGSTNRTELLDKAILRRFDSKIYFGMPDEQEINEIISSGLASFSFSDAQISSICGMAKGCTQGVIMSVIKKLKSLEFYDKTMSRLNKNANNLVNWNDSNDVILELKKLFGTSEKVDGSNLDDANLAKHPYVQHLVENKQKQAFLGFNMANREKRRTG